MKLKELQEIENETLTMLRTLATGGDVAAAEVILKHVRRTSIVIDNWRSNKRKEEKQNGTQPK